MVSSQLCDRVKALVGQINEPYELTEEVIVPAGRDYILAKYLKDYLALPEQEKEALIDRLHQGWQEWGEEKGFDDREVRAWGRAPIGAANLFCFTDIAELRQKNKLELAADVIVRISRWFQTQSNFWMPMRPHATELVKKVWGKGQPGRPPTHGWSVRECQGAGAVAFPP